jgi:predicted DNA-binding protein (UPF0251 family)/predicted Fe-Mo cluster-binding NifX family protein
MHERSDFVSTRIKRYARRLSGKRSFKPAGIPVSQLKTVHMNLDEFEALRLVDYEGFSQIEASEEMQISRATVQRLLAKARKKTVDAVLHNHILEVNNEITNIKLKGENKYDIASKDHKTIAFPTSDKVTIDSHFGRASSFALYTVDNHEIKQIVHLIPPPHAPGVIPKFLKEHKVDVVITKSMGAKAVTHFAESNIDIILGASGRIDVNLNEYLAGFLSSTEKSCIRKEKSL